jgi:hypothetical protein
VCQGSRGRMESMDFHKGERSVMGGNKVLLQPSHGEEMDRAWDWAVEVYRGKETAAPPEEGEEDILELSLEEEEGEISSKFLAFAVFFSQKSYNPRFLFTDMHNAWGIKALVAIEKLGDYSFRLEFASADEKHRVVEGGP